MQKDINYWIARCATLEQEIEMLKEQSVIKWQTGKPNASVFYLVQTKHTYGIVLYSTFTESWVDIPQSEVIAWCKLSDIQPYKNKEETKWKK